ncbi:HAD-IA family hydrolase [Candidatus Saccharibacteria bacterium]|nr:HAD-IA family hydrolase [Candidatus Saccharibacteria bacterium]
MIRAIIFDCFGVVITDELKEIRADLARTNPDAAAEVSDILAANNRGYIGPDESSSRIAAILGQSLDQFRTVVARREIKNAALLEYIPTLRSVYKTAMLSNVALSSLNRRFPEHELRQYFDVVVTSAEIGHAKPDPEAYILAADRLGVRPDECVFTDDKESFCDAAELCGMRAIVYKSFEQFQGQLDTMLTQK